MSFEIARSKPVQFRLIDVGLPLNEDPEGQAFVEVRPATQGDLIERANLTADASRVLREDLDAVEVRQKWNIEEQRMLEAYLTVSGCNLAIEDEIEAGKFVPAFNFVRTNGQNRPVSRESFYDGWRALPPSFALAIHTAVLRVNPQWDPKR
jgi:hypothetical protein